MRRWLLRNAVPIVVACAAQCHLFAQEKLARIEGQVVGERDEKPLRRAHVTLRPVEAGLSAVGAEADDKGNFALHDVQPGRYSMVAERDGYLASTTFLKGAQRMPPVFYVGAGQSVRGVTFKLKAWAVITGKIHFDDGDPAINIRVAAYREFHQKGRHGYNVIAMAGTNDLGEYRIHGLQPGAYFIAAIYERPSSPGYREQAPVDEQGKELPWFGYTTTFFPNTPKLSEAVSVRLDYGREAGGIDIFLRPVRKVKIRGTVTSGISGTTLSSASIVLERADAHNNGAIAVPATAKFDRLTSKFEIADVTPGTYQITASSEDNGAVISTMTALTVADQDIDTLELLLKPQRRGAAKLKIEGGGKLDAKASPVLAFEPRSGRGATVSASLGRTEVFDFWLTDADIYDAYVRNLPDDFYVAEVRVSGSNVIESGVRGAATSWNDPIEVVVDSRGGKVGGRVASSDGTPWSGANVMLVPDPAKGRLQSYREGYASEYGEFIIRGVPPGKYILLAWLDEPPCDAYDSDNLDSCRSAGMLVSVERGGQENVIFTPKKRP